MAAVARLAPAAKLTDEAAGSLTFTIESKFVTQIPELFRWIEANTATKGSKGAAQSEGVQLTDWSISHTTLEDVFIRLTRIHDDKSDKPPASKAAATMTASSWANEHMVKMDAETPIAVATMGASPMHADPEHADDVSQPYDPEASQTKTTATSNLTAL